MEKVGAKEESSTSLIPTDDTRRGISLSPFAAVTCWEKGREQWVEKKEDWVRVGAVWWRGRPTGFGAKI